MARFALTNEGDDRAARGAFLAALPKSPLLERAYHRSLPWAIPAGERIARELYPRYEGTGAN